MSAEARPFILLAVAWLWFVARPALRLAFDGSIEIGSVSILGLYRQAVSQLTSLPSGGEKLASIVFVLVVLLVLVGVPLVVRTVRPSWTIPSLIGLWIALAVGFAAGAHVLTDLLWLALFGVGVFELGHRILCRLGTLFDDRLEWILLAATAGSGLFGLVGLVLGAAGVLIRPCLITLLVLPAGLFVARSGWELVSWWRAVERGREERRPWRPSAFETALLGILAAMLLIGFATAVAPEVHSDAVRVHLGMARRYAALGSLPTLPFIGFTDWPLNAQLLFTVAFILKGPILAKLLHATAGLLTIASAYLLGRRLAGRRAGLVAATLLATVPLCLWELGTANVDFFAACYVAAAALCFLRWQDSGQARWLVLSGGLLGLGVASKLTVGFSAVAFAAAVMIVGREGAALSARCTALVWMALGGFATLGPWLLRGFILTGRVPGILLLPAVVAPHGSAAAAALANLPGFGIGRSFSVLPDLPWALTFQTSRFGENSSGFLGVAVLLLLPAMAFLRPRRGVLALVVLSAVPLFLWFVTAQYLRYLLPTLPFWSVLLACGFVELQERGLGGDRRPWMRRLLGVAFLGAVLCSPALFLASVFVYPGALPVQLVLGRETSEAYRMRTLPQYAVLRHIAHRHPAPPVAVIPEGLQMYSDAVLVGPLNGGRWLIVSRSAGELIDQFELGRMEYLVVDRNAIPARWWARYAILQQSFLQGHADIVYASANVYLYRIRRSSEPLTALGPELLENPGFETSVIGYPASWHGFGVPTYDRSGTTSHGGRAAVKIAKASSYHQAVPVSGGRPYYLSHFSRCEAVASVRLQINWLDARGGLMTPSIEVRPGATAFVQQALWAVAPTGARSAHVYVSTHDGAPCWFDDFSFKEVLSPEGKAEAAPPPSEPLGEREPDAITNSPGVVFEAIPNPIQVCRDGVGVTTIAWSGIGPREIQVRVDSPDGPLFAQHRADGRATTERWVRNGMRFYLQDVTSGLPLVAANTLATVTARVTNAGCPA